MDYRSVLEKIIKLSISLKRIPTQTEISTNLNMSTTQLRSYVGSSTAMKSIIRKHMSFDKKDKLISTKLKRNIQESVISNISNELSLSKIRVKKLSKLVKDLEKKSILNDQIVDLIQDNIQAYPNNYKSHKKEKKIKTKEKNELLLLLSDFHAGAVINKEEMGGLNEYNIKIMVKRYQYLIDYVLHKAKKYNNIDTINIAMLGDMVNGDIHDEFIRTNELNVVDASFLTASLLTQGILDLSNEFKHVKVVGIVGNHGRLRSTPYYKNKYVNWDYVTYKTIESSLKNQKNISCHFPKSFYTVESILNHKIALLHGDNVRSWNSIPLYGINRTADRLNNALKYNNKSFEYIMIGHFHNTGQLDKATGEIIINSSLCGVDEYALGKMFTMSKPKQLFMCVNENDGIDWRVPVNLDRCDKIIKDSEIRYKINY